MRRIIVATVTIFIFLSALLAGQLALVSPAKAQTAPPPPGSYNVKDYGARGDGITNDTNAIQAAIDSLPSAGGTLYFPAGIYIVKASAAETYSILQLKQKQTRVFGGGVGISTIKVADNCPTYLWLMSGSRTGIDLTGLEICDLTFDHNIANNPITNEAEIMAWGEFTCGTYLGSNVNIHDLEVINASSVNNIVVNGVGNTNITIDNIHCSVMGDDPNHVSHDASFIYIHGSDYSISNCDLSCASPGLPGGSTAIECHGTDYTVTNNTIVNWGAGVIATGVAEVTAENVEVVNNDISGCVIGIYIWSCQYGAHTTGYGIDGMNIHANTIDIEVVGGVGDTQTRGGIYINATNDLDINGLNIHDNDITGTLETVAGGSSNISIGIGWWDANNSSYKISNSTITNNTINNFPNAGIRFSCNVENCKITGNTLRDTGSTMVEIPDAYRTPMFIAGGSISGLEVSGNTFIDDLPITRNRFFIYALASSSRDFNIVNNSFQVTGSNRAAFERQVELGSDIPCPLITGQITGFVPPAHKVQTTSRVTDGSYVWVVGSDGLTWTNATPPKTSPTISSISPTSGNIGATVTVSGSGLGSTQGSSYVSFGSVKATDYISWSDTQVKCKVPSGVWDSVNITLTTEGGTSNSKSFTVVPPVVVLQISSISPTSGNIGATVTVSGSGLGSTQGSSYVSFGSVKATDYISWSDTQVKCKVPSGVWDSVNITLTTEGGTSNSKSFTVVPPVVVLQISSISPTSGNIGATVTVSGSGLGSTQGSSYVSFGSVKATDYISWSDTQVKCNVPSGVSGRVGVTASTTSGISAPKSFKVVPRISRISPTSGKTGTRVTVTGTGFGNSWGSGKGGSGNESSSVIFNGAQVSNCPQWSDTEITAVVPEGATTGPVMIVVDGTESNADNTLMLTHASSFYFAEGYTGDNFAEYLCIGNPNNTEATALVTYMFSDGTTKDASYNVPDNSRHTVNVNSEVGPNKEVSIRVLSETANLVAERPMYFNYNGAWTGGSVAVGASSPAKNWYFAEGNTQEGFDQYVTVLNPGSTTAKLTFHYMVEGVGEVPVGAQVNPNTRATFKTRDQIGPGKNASLFLESDQDVVAERSMYFDYQGLASNNWTGGHVVVGANSPAKDWYFAEGTTRAGFEQWLCLQNPGSEPITVDATYMPGSGQGGPVGKSYIVPAQQRLTVSVNKELGPDKDVSVKLSSSSDFIAERPVYFDYQGVWDGGHDVLGANDSANTWFFADGYTGDNFNEWLCLQNPGDDVAKVTITYYPTSGTPISKPHTVPPNSRLTVNVNDDAGSNLEISTKVSSDKPIIAERPMYFAYQGTWTGGHDVVGFVSSP